MLRIWTKVERPSSALDSRALWRSSDGWGIMRKDTGTCFLFRLDLGWSYADSVKCVSLLDAMDLANRVAKELRKLHRASV